jgi:cell wall-associated NlpC family hydrolase
LTYLIAISGSLAGAATGSLAAGAAPALGADTLSGGTSAGSVAHTTAVSPATAGGSTPVGGGAPAGAPTTPAPTRAPTVHAPVTAHTSSIAYNGPVYERSVTGTVVPYVVPPPAGTTNGSTGGSAAAVVANAKPELLVPGTMARYVDGLAAAPMAAPLAVQEIVWAGNQIIGLPYIFGGGHGSFTSPGDDCSGTVSFALHGASLLKAPMDSSEFMGWGGHGIGRWVTVFTNPEHAYMTVAGLRLDTSAADDPSNQQGPRWRPLRPANAGFRVRHPAGL